MENKKEFNSNARNKIIWKNAAVKSRKEREWRLGYLKNEFINSVSHELMTPLAIIKEGNNLVLDKVVGNINEKQQSVLTIVKDNIDRLARVINELLDIYSREA